MGFHNQAFEHVQREFYSSQETHIPIGEGFTDIFRQNTITDEQSFLVPSELGIGSSRRIPFGNSVEACLYDMRLHRSMQMSGRTQGDVYILMFCLGEDVMWHETNSDKTITLETGTGVLYHAKNINETGFYNENRHYQGITLYLNPQIFGRYFTDAAQDHVAFRDIDVNYMPLKYILPSESKIILSEALNCNYSGSIRTMYLEGKAIELAAACMSAIIEKENGKDGIINLSKTDIESIVNAREYLDDHFASPITISSLARRVLLNETKLKRGFRIIYGKPIYSYLIDKRMETARILLETKDMNVSQIADFVGYGSGSSFSKAFHKKFGFNPSDCISEK